MTDWTGTTSYSYDGNGSMTTMPQVDNWSTGQTVTYDAWNRPITVAQSGTTLGTYQYDGLNRRTWKQSVESGTLTTRDFYYSNQWQVLEERTGASSSAKIQYVWGTRYADDLVLRDYYCIGTTTYRHYALADYFQPTAIANSSGTVEERYVYRAFGDVSYYNSSFSSISSSAYNWTYLYGTYPLDLETNLYQVRYRYYHSALGRWLSRDPFVDEKGNDAEMAQGANLYWYVSNNAANAVDDLGLSPIPGNNNPPNLQPTYHPALLSLCTDDAGLICCCSQIKKVWLRSDTTDVPPHTFLTLPFGPKGTGYGYFPAIRNTPFSPGTVLNNTNHPYDKSKSYRVCPSTLEKLLISIGSNAGGMYNLKNTFPGQNCTGWACSQLSNAGLTPPASGSQPYVSPYQVP